MKKILILTIILSTLSCCYAQDGGNDMYQEDKEIHLDLNTGTKGYNLKRNEIKNEENSYIDDDNDNMPVNFANPLQMFQQFQQNQY
ncbi:MAG: hypothetical protein K6E29_03065 [Cyanobacteria bacterium RUI128]|nr:hypothetical protein [Cyanobacteria bacterium RUI128]